MGRALELLEIISAPAVDGRGGSLDDGLPDERFSRFNDFATSGTDLLCGEEGSGGSVCAADASGGKGV